ncbi:hypothetical protein [Methanobrevibacter sp.]|uniref:hypothetical protein n=1 Tax=Methanobrevibacter sp. TaxID=66852 RepID=UPI0026DEDDD7|nr:hypothetical protein [Methanobrevibacter sp.]MDO5823317.1 hypothetical protein [Methanobrevibacter sp.]
MPLSEEEILLTIMNEQQECDKKNNPKSGSGSSILGTIIFIIIFFSFAIFIPVFGLYGIAIWLIVFAAYLLIHIKKG